MNMLEEVEKFLADTGISVNYRTINIGGKFLYVEGLKNVVCLGTEEMLFQLKKQALKVRGRDLKIKYLDTTTCVIEGNIVLVEVN